MQTLQSYDMSPERGFLCQFDANRVALTGDLAAMRDVAMSLPALLPSGRVRQLLTDRLPALEAGAFEGLSDAELRIAMVHYSFMVQAYVWGEAEAPAVLPRCLAVPIVALADRLGQQPLLPYSGYVLDNWAEIEPGRGITLDNTYMIQPFLGGQDEACETDGKGG